MSTTTEKLALFKYDPSTDGAQTFNIKQAMNDNWDKIDDAVKDIDTTLQKKADKSVAFTVTLTAAGWSDNAQTVSNENFLSTGYAYTVAPASGSFSNYAEAMIYADDVASDGQMVFHCDSAPTADLTVNILRMVTAE